MSYIKGTEVFRIRVPETLNVYLSKFNGKQLKELEKLCQEVMENFVRSSQSKLISFIRDNLPDLDITQELIDMIFETCRSDIEECVKQKWNTDSKENLYRSIQKQFPKVVDAAVIDEKLGYYRETKMNLLIKMFSDGGHVVKGVYNEKDWEKPWILNKFEVSYCKRMNLNIDPLCSFESYERKSKVKIIWKYWKRYFYESRDVNGENPYIKSLKQKQNSMIQ